MLVALIWGCSGSDGTTPKDGATNDTVPEPALVLSAPSWRLHEDFGSMPIVSWIQTVDAVVRVEIQIDPGEWTSSPPIQGYAGENEQTIPGVPYHVTAPWRVVAADGRTAVNGGELTTADVPEGLPKGKVTVSEPDRWLPEGRFLLTSINEREGGWTGGTYWTFIIDRKGRPVWAQQTPRNHWSLFATVDRDGRSLWWDEQTYWASFGVDDGRNSTLHHVWLDAEIEEVPTPGLHHAWVQLPDGTLAWGSRAHGGNEALVQRVPGQADETVLWTCADDWPNSGDCESNGLFYVEATDSFLYSFYTNDSIVEVDRATGQSLWWAGEVPGGYAFSPERSQYLWQHGLSYTPTGTLLLSSEWDGGANEHGHCAGLFTQTCTTWLMEYEVDPATKELRAVWTDDSEVLADTNGQAWRLANGNTLHLVGSAGVIREVDTATGDDVWRVDFRSDRLIGAGQFIDDLYDLLQP
ncbi:MAG: hypothetical protein H6735_33960 [Alphaproteobacteria bacterium]|nr:hypothetical protein [Alphaproteobacteria bacterium]